MSIHQTFLFRQLSEDVTLFRHTMPEPEPAERDQLAAMGVRIVDGVVKEIRGADGALRTVVLEGGDEIERDALAVAPRFLARAELYEQLGGTLTENPMGVFVEADRMGRTDIPGVWAAGNVSDLAAAVAASAAAGVSTAGGINADLIAEDVAAAVRLRGQTP
jgi:thioredoxin reductase (NADPH)